jgi:microsomal dipeptidase-like Zn-dependent dipeptidase
MRIDLHSHPALKTYLWNAPLDRALKTSAFVNLFALQTDCEKLVTGNMDVMVVAHYLPEARILRDSNLLHFVEMLGGPLLNGLLSKIEDDSTAERPYQQTLKMLDLFEASVTRAAQNGCRIAIARSRAEMELLQTQGQRVLLQAVEGGHSLGHELPPVRYLDHLQKLFDRGICMLTLGHFFPNDFVSPVNSVPELDRQILGWTYHDEPPEGLTNAGRELVHAMLEMGMIIDLTHCKRQARTEIFGLNRARGNSQRPLVFSHTGIATICDQPMNPIEEEVRVIRDCGGVIGVIFCNDWLVDPGFTVEELITDKGLKNIAATMIEIRRIAGTWDCVAIGTDFDGMTNPTDDLRDTSFMDRLITELQNRGVTSTEVDAITGKNALRVLQMGWNR